jgi:hypothetical protein
VQETAHEGLGPGLSEIGSERNHRHEVDAGGGEQAAFLRPREQGRRGFRRGEDGQGMGLEGHHHGRQPELAGATRHPVEHRPLATVNAVVVADRHDRGMRQLDGTQRIGDDLHRGSRGQATEAATSTPGLPTGPTIRPTRSLAKASVISTRANVPAGAEPSLISRRPSISGAIP